MEGTKLPFPFLFLTVICTNGWHCGLTTTSTLTTCQQHLAPTTPVRLMSLPSLSVSLSVCLSVCLVTNMITVICTNGWHRGLTGTSTLTTCQQLLALTTAPVRLMSLPSLCLSVCLFVCLVTIYVQMYVLPVWCRVSCMCRRSLLWLPVRIRSASQSRSQWLEVLAILFIL